MRLGDIVGPLKSFLSSDFPIRLPTNSKLDILKHISSMKALSSKKDNEYWYTACALELIQLYEKRSITVIIIYNIL